MQVRSTSLLRAARRGKSQESPSKPRCPGRGTDSGVSETAWALLSINGAVAKSVLPLAGASP